MINARGVRVVRGGRALLDRVSVAAASGEVVALLGPNGAGKSTLLRVLSGELVPNAGEVAIGGRALRHWKPDALARVRAVLPQASSLDFPFLVHEVVELGRAPHEDAAHAGVIAREALAAVGLSALAMRPFPLLSGGERQRVHFARVLAQVWTTDGRGAACLLDEPVAALDPRHQHEVLRTARQVADRGVAMIVVLHDLSLAARYADRVVLMRDGVVLADGTPGAVLDPGRLEPAYDIPFAVLEDRDGALLVLPRPATI